MNDRLRMRRDKSFDELQGQREQIGFGEMPCGYPGAERAACDVFHYQEIGIPLRIKIVDRGDVGMIQFRKCEGLVAKAVTSGFVADGSGMEKLESETSRRRTGGKSGGPQTTPMPPLPIFSRMR